MRPDESRASEATPTAAPHPARSDPPAPAAATLPAGLQPCPSCGHPMPDLKGGTTSICAVCGFKDSCCY
ncbi:MAG TPA: hypothetical protein VET66_11465 [Steroidobacteraceae bacterium]|nr:hypothetical protein [Steroidobacteraceae bacterium]